MQSLPIPFDEHARLDNLHSLGVLDTLPQQAFEDITDLASSICGTPIALISLVDKDRQWFKSKVGLNAAETPREIAFCAHAIMEPDNVMVVEDARNDPRFRNNPLVVAEPEIRFYAGAPIVSKGGFALGTVCVIDRVPKVLTSVQLQSLKSLSSLVSTLMEQEKSRLAAVHRDTLEAREQAQIVNAIASVGLNPTSFVDSAYTYRHINQAYLEYWLREPKEILGKTVSALMGETVFESTVKPHLDRAMVGESVHFDAPIPFPGKGVREMEISYLPARDEAGSVFGVVVRAHDVQQRKEHEVELEQAIELLKHKTLEQERFIHIVSHDLREPINTINNFTSLLLDDEALNLPADAQRYLKFVAAGGLRMQTLLEDLVGFLHLERHTLEKKRVDLTVIATQVRDDLAAALQSNQGRIEFDHLPVAYGDPSMLRIVLQNLVSNGLKFVRKETPPIVKITARIEDDTIHIAVIDNGIGMEDQHIDKIFEMFKRLHSKHEFPGTGLGLSTCRRIAQLHGGELHVTSKPDIGSTFELSIPMLPTNTE